MEYEIGHKLDDQYVILEQHQGGMSTVYVVRDEFSDKRFAVKTVREELMSDAQAVGRFAAEGRTWMKLGRHTNIVEAIIYREIAGQPFLFLEFVDGGNLQVLLDRERTLFLPQLLDFARQGCEGMQYVHTVEISPTQKGVIHRDLKPANLMLSRQCQVKITDFGLAKVYGARVQAVETGVGLGTYLYMPPEQFVDAASADERSDLYSFAVVLYAAMTGRAPHEGKNPAQVVHSILNQTPASPADLRPEIHPALGQLILACLSRQRTDRPGSFEELRRELEPFRTTLAEDPEWRKPVQACTGCGYLTRHPYPRCPICAADFVDRVFGEAVTAGQGPAERAPVDTAAQAEELFQQALQDEAGERLEQALNTLRRAASLARGDQRIMAKLDEVAQKYRAQRAPVRGKTYNWPMESGNPTRSGFTPESVAPPLNLRWTARLSEWAVASPVVSNGVVFAAVGSSRAGARGCLVALESLRGEELWRREFPRELTVSPAVVGGNALLLPMDRELQCLEASTGAPRWMFVAQETLTCSPLAFGNTVCAGDAAGRLYAVDAAAGRPLWTAELGGAIYSPPAVWKNRVYVGTSARRLHALGAQDGMPYWEYAVGGEVSGGPSVSEDRVLFGTTEGHVYCLVQATGQLVWDFEAQGEIHGTPALAGDALYFGSRDGTLHCVELVTGRLRWQFPTQDWVDAAPPISENFIYCAGHDGWLRVLEAFSGISLWEYEVGEEIRAGGALSGGHLYLLTAASQLLGFRGR